MKSQRPKSKLIPKAKSKLSSKEASKNRDKAELARMVDSRIGRFAAHVLTARVILQNYPELVTAKGFPAHLRGPYRREYKEDPDHADVASYGTPEPNIKELRRQLQEAKRDRRDREKAAKEAKK